MNYWNSNKEFFKNLKSSLGFIFPSILSTLINVCMKAIALELETDISCNIYQIREIFFLNAVPWCEILTEAGWQFYWPSKCSQFAVNPCGKKSLRNFWLRNFYYPFKMKYTSHFFNDKSRYFMLLSVSGLLKCILISLLGESSWVSELLT